MATQTNTKKRTRSSRKTREAEATKEYENFLDASTTANLVSAQADDDLFVVDRGGSKNKKRKIQKDEQQKQTSGTTSKTEQLLISRIKNKKKEPKVVKAKKDEAFDLWDEEKISKQQRSTTRKSFKKIAGPGMSYNPSHDDHQEALAEVNILQ